MKVSVITLHTVNNYGSVLQTYATQVLLEKLGYTVEFVDYHRKNNSPSSFANVVMNGPRLKKYINIWEKNMFIKNTVVFILSRIYIKQQKSFRTFLKHRVNLTPKEYNSFEEILRDVPDADIYMTGSDQVWNSIWNGGIDKAFFLEYAPQGKKRIAYAASIGRESLDEYEINSTKKMLLKYSSIGMREQSGVDLLNKMGIKSQLVLDPTLMLTREDWSKICKPTKKRKPYILVYQLNKNIEIDEYVNQLALKNKVEIIRIEFAYLKNKKNGTTIILPEVEEVIGLMKNATCVITDSFHATAFSLNLNKNFIVFLPKQFSTRLQSVLSLTGTENRILKDYSDFSLYYKTIDYEYVNSVLEKERKKSLIFLEEAINE